MAHHDAPLEPVEGSASIDEDSATEAVETLAPAEAPPAQRVRPTPHQSKLHEVAVNPKLPSADEDRAAAAILRYDQWIQDMSALRETGDAKVVELVKLLNGYKRYVELNFIWDSPADFLFRQRGQTKIDNSIIEEFLPWLVDLDIIPELADIDVFAGPASAFSAAYFGSTLTNHLNVGLRTRTKDQDFTLSRPAYLRASFDPSFPLGASETESLWLAYIAAECKTNLDKTMFQGANRDAHDLKVAVPAARYLLICEFLDMLPISTVTTDIDEVLVLRGKRMASNQRQHYGTAQQRAARRTEYVEWLDAHPVRADVIQRFVDHLRSLFTHEEPDEEDVLSKGYF